MFGILSIIITTILTLIFFMGSKLGSGYLPEMSWVLAAQLTGILGIFWLSLTYILASRLHFLQKIFAGFDKLYRWHHLLGALAFLTLIHHPLFLILAHLPTNTLTTYLLPSTNLPYTLGIFAFYFLTLLISLTIFIDLPYWLWKQTHEWMGIVILLGALHSLFVPSDISRHPLFAAWMFIWILLALVSTLYKRFFYYWLLLLCEYILL
jgi:predicted ferric reductase